MDMQTYINKQTRRKEGNVLFNKALNRFFLRLFDVGHIVKDHSARKWKPAVVTLHGLLFPIREVGGGGGQLLTCPYPLKVQARPPRDQRLAL